MDIWELLPLIIFGAIYLFGVGKKKEEEAKKKAAKRAGQSQSRSTEPVAKNSSSLQERLDAALREMQSRVEGDPVRSTVDDVDDVSNNIGRMASETLYDRDVIEYDSPLEEYSEDKFEVKTDLDRPTLLESKTDGVMRPAIKPIKVGFDSMTSMPSEEDGYYGFSEAHGMHYSGYDSGYDSGGYAGETTESLMPSKKNEFRQAHGLHYSESHLTHQAREEARRRAEAGQNVGEPVFRNPSDIRRAVIAAEILTPRGQWK